MSGRDGERPDLRRAKDSLAGQLRQTGLTSEQAERKAREAVIRNHEGKGVKPNPRRKTT